MAISKVSLYETALFLKNEHQFVFAFMYNQGKTKSLNWLNKRTIEVPDMTTNGFKSRNRDSIDGVFNRNHDTTFSPLTVQQEREWDTLVDKYDEEESNQIAIIGNATEVFNRSHKIPEFDAYASSALFGISNTNGNTITKDLATGQLILDELDVVRVNWDDAGVPSTGRYVIVTYATWNQIENALKTDRRANWSTDKEFSKKVIRYNEVTIVGCPTARFNSAYTFGEGTNTPTGVTMTFIAMQMDGVLAPIKHNDMLLDPPTAKTKNKSLYYESCVWDVLATPQLKENVVACVPTTTP